MRRGGYYMAHEEYHQIFQLQLESQFYHGWWVSMKHNLWSSQFSSLLIRLHFTIALQAVVIHIWNWWKNGVYIKSTKKLFEMKSWCTRGFQGQHPLGICTPRRSGMIWRCNMDVHQWTLFYPWKAIIYIIFLQMSLRWLLRRILHWKYLLTSWSNG